VEHMAIGYSAFDRIAVEQRRPCFAANDQSEFPSDIGGVPKCRIEPLTAKRAGQMRGVAEQKSAPIACALGGTHVHLEIGHPSQIVQSDIDANAVAEQSIEVVGRRKLGPRIGLIAIDE